MCHFSDNPLSVREITLYFPPYAVPPFTLFYPDFLGMSSVFRYFVRLRCPFYYHPKKLSTAYPQLIHRVIHTKKTVNTRKIKGLRDNSTFPHYLLLLLKKETIQG